MCRFHVAVLAVLVAACAFPVGPVHAQAFGRRADEGAAADGAPAAVPAAGAGVATGPLMQILDVDGDGTLSTKEIRAAAKSLLKLDTNHDRKLTPDEIAAGAAGAVPDRGAGDRHAGRGAGCAGAGGFGAGGGVGGAAGGMVNPGLGAGATGGNRGGVFNRAPGSGLPSSANRIMGFDKNRDGRVSRDELPAQLWTAMQRFDLDRDGVLNPLELRRAIGGRN